MMLRVALTGGIATGKSYCLARFASLGVPTIDADRLARDVVAPGSRALEQVATRFGASILRDDGSLDRPSLGRIVFADPAARADLEAIVHPEVYRRIGEWLATLPPRTRLAVADIPLLFETGHTHDFDRVVVVACDPRELIRRIIARDGLSEREARGRLDSQWPIEDKAARADYVIKTDGTAADTDSQVKTVYEMLNAEC
jgi:dephospho-CoA kinase